MKKIVLLAGLLFSQVSLAEDPIFTAFLSDKAIRGYDTVAYFTENAAVEGSSEFVTEYKGAKWLFSSAENLALFQENPEKYAPQYGGYCAYAVAKGGTAPIQADQFTIHDGKLYLNYNASINEKWHMDKEGYIASADKNWPEVLDD